MLPVRKKVHGSPRSSTEYAIVSESRDRGGGANMANHPARSLVKPTTMRAVIVAGILFCSRYRSSDGERLVVVRGRA
jgi:hypothetical protein